MRVAQEDVQMAWGLCYIALRGAVSGVGKGVLGSLQPATKAEGTPGPAARSCHLQQTFVTHHSQTSS